MRESEPVLILRSVVVVHASWSETGERESATPKSDDRVKTTKRGRGRDNNRGIQVLRFSHCCDGKVALPVEVGSLGYYYGPLSLVAGQARDGRVAGWIVESKQYRTAAN